MADLKWSTVAWFVVLLIGGICFEVWKWHTYYQPLGLPWWAMR